MPAATSTTQVKAGPPHYAPSKEDEEDLRAINGALERMRKVLPQDPYVLTIPQDVEPRYHHYSEAVANQWRYNTPFYRDDHPSLQYQTYVYHEHGKEIYILENSRPLDNSTTKDEGGRRARAGTGVNTPNTSAPKKKITLGDYKKKLTGPNATPGTSQGATQGVDPASSQNGAVKGPVERLKAESEEMLAAVAEAETKAAPVRQEKQAAAQPKEMKRKREDEHNARAEDKATENSKIAVNTHNDNAQPVPKKVKTAEERPTKSGNHIAPRQTSGTKQSSQQSVKEDQHEETSAPLGMPPRLSPGMPEKLSPIRVDDAVSSKRPAAKKSPQTSMPSRLSPTLPDNILRSLESRPQPHPGSDSSAPKSARKSKDGKLTAPARPNGITKKKSPVPKNGFRASSSPAVGSDVDDGPASKAQVVQRARSPELSREEEIAVGKSISAKKLGRTSLMVTFTFKKPTREYVQRVLKMRPQPEHSTVLAQKLFEEVEKARGKPQEQQGAIKTASTAQKGVAAKVEPIKKEKKPLVKQEATPAVSEEPKQPTKRLLVDDDRNDDTLKRTKGNDSRKQPSTPAPKEADSPMAQKSTLPATPSTRKDLLSAATMQRQHSQDSITNYTTPPAQASTPSIGTSSSQANGMARMHSSQPSTKTPKQQAWENEQKRLEILGRDIKRAAGTELQANPNDLKTQRLCAVKNVEALLCYVLAYTCADEAGLAAEPRYPPSLKLWRGLVGLYKFVKGNTKHFALLNGLTCYLGMAFHARILDIATQHHPKDGLDRAALQETVGYMQKAAMDAEARLDVDVLQEAFPQTWAKRGRKLPLTEKLDAPKLDGPYKLPIGVTTSPIRAARAGHAMLLEWLEREKLDYDLKLKLN